MSSRSRSRGASYFQSGRVSVVSADAASLTASVRGTRKYDVASADASLIRNLRREDLELLLS